MVSVSSPTLEPGTLLESKYRVGEPLAVATPPACFAGTVTSTDEPVVLVEIDAALAPQFARAKSVHHMYLARIHDVIQAPTGQMLLVCERVTGETLAKRLEQGPKPAVDAVRSALRVADALSALHDAGAVHGSITPEIVIVAPEGRAAPVLCFGHPGADGDGFRSPARRQGQGPSEADDSWAVAALLHVMLTGKAPPLDGYDSNDALLTAGVADQALRDALFHALNADAEQRSRDLRPLKRELARWFVEHAGEEPIPPGPHSTSPPPLPSQTPISMSPAMVRDARPAPKKGSRIALLAAGGIVLGLAGGWIFSSMRAEPPVEVVEPPPQPAASAPEEKKAIELNDVPVTGESESIVGADKTASCVAGYLPKETFAKAPDFSWMCGETDPRVGADKLRVAIVSAAPKGAGPTEAMKIFARIGWYDMAAYAMVRAGCCLDAKPLALPAPSPSCGDMAEALREIGKEVVAVRSPEEALKKYTAAIHCELNAGRGATFRRNQRPAGGEDTAFLELIKAIQ